MPDISDLLAKERAALSDAVSWRGIKHRSFKYEFAALEISIISKFNEHLSVSPFSNKVELEGFVSRLGGMRFLLRPSLAVDYGVVCELSDLRRLPTDFEFGRVTGYRVLRKQTALEAIRWKINAESFEPVRLPHDSLRPEATAAEIEETLWAGYVDPPQQMTRNLLHSVISAPGEISRLGGLTATMMPLEDKYSPSLGLLLDDLKRSVPGDLTSESRIQISVEDVGRFEIAPFPWSMVNTSEKTQSEYFSLLARGSTKNLFEEVTVGFSASSASPNSLGDVWIRKSDYPMLADGAIQRHSPAASQDLAVAKFMITVHSLNPYTDRSVEDGILELVRPRLVKLRKDYDNLGYDGLIDMDVLSGSPRSILAIAKSIARLEGEDTVGADHVRLALEQFVDARVDVFEAWAERDVSYNPEHLSTEMKVKLIGKTAERVYRYLSNHPDSSKAELREALPRVQDRIFEKTLEEMIRMGVIYRTSTIEERFSAV